MSDKSNADSARLASVNDNSSSKSRGLSPYWILILAYAAILSPFYFFLIQDLLSGGEFGIGGIILVGATFLAVIMTPIIGSLGRADSLVIDYSDPEEFRTRLKEKMRTMGFRLVEETPSHLSFKMRAATINAEFADTSCTITAPLGRIGELRSLEQKISQAPEAIANVSTSQSLTEKHNRGTRHDNMAIAYAYWVNRQSLAKKDPFLLYDFETEEDARKALLELPCIHIAADSGKLICTEVLIFGYYYQEHGGKYEAIVCGGDLTHELWEQAKASFIKHGGKPRGQGELEPEKRVASVQTPDKVQPNMVTFVREDREDKQGVTFIYQIYKGPNRQTAISFLEKNPVTKQFFYIVVETPEGNYCRDIQGIYKE